MHMLVIIKICQMHVLHKTVHLFRGKPYMKKMIIGCFSVECDSHPPHPTCGHRDHQGQFERILLLRLCGLPEMSFQLAWDRTQALLFFSLLKLSRKFYCAAWIENN